MVNTGINETKELMQKAVVHLENELHKIRVGKSSPQMLDGVRVESYGSMVPVAQVANISTPDAKTILIQRFY